MAIVIPPLTNCEAFDQKVAITDANTNECATVIDGAVSVTQLNALVPESYNSIDLTYIVSGNGIGEIATVVYKLDTVPVATLTLAYNTDDKLSSVTKA